MEEDAAAAVAGAMRGFAALGFVSAFGHCSARVGDVILITPTTPPRRHQAEMVLKVDSDGEVLRGDPATRPIEVHLHLAIYAARTDVAAICRTHSPAASVAASSSRLPGVAHGFGGLAGRLAYFEEPDLISDSAKGAAAAQALGDADALFLRGNGAACVGADIVEAAACAWGLEERCRLAQCAGTEAFVFSAIEREQRSAWYPAERKRVWNWLVDLGTGAAVT